MNKSLSRTMSYRLLGSCFVTMAEIFWLVGEYVFGRIISKCDNYVKI